MATTSRHHRQAAALAAALLSLLQLSAWVAPAHGHAVMIDPKSRPWYDYLENYNYNPHAVYAGGEGPGRRRLGRSILRPARGRQQQ
jgi:hypothetical protein